jgi:phosphoribosylamine--glycine ligase
MGLSDGQRILPLATAKDYKRIGNDDTGPNTGGMGSHTPAGVIGAAQAREILERVLQPTVAGMAEEGNRFVGVLYAGLMLTAEGPQVLEFNVRLGDPEAQCLLLRMEDRLLDLLQSGAAGDFGRDRIAFRKQAAACIVLANEGYPERPATGDPIAGLKEAAFDERVQVFHAGTRNEGGQVIASGGRVLNVCATGDNLRDALRHAYTAAGKIEWPHKVMRTDIGRRVLERDELQTTTELSVRDVDERVRRERER